jgi:hypothetical protein
MRAEANTIIAGVLHRSRSNARCLTVQFGRSRPTFEPYCCAAVSCTTVLQASLTRDARAVVRGGRRGCSGAKNTPTVRRAPTRARPRGGGVRTPVSLGLAHATPRPLAVAPFVGRVDARRPPATLPPGVSRHTRAFFTANDEAVGRRGDAAAGWRHGVGKSVSAKRSGLVSPRRSRSTRRVRGGADPTELEQPGVRTDTMARQGMRSRLLDVSLQATVMALAVVGASACGDGPKRTRGSGIPLPPPLGACVDANDGAESAGSARFEGRVDEVGLGMPDPAGTNGCPFGDTLRFGPPGLGEAALLAQVSWVRIRNADDQDIVVSALAEGFAFPVGIGDLVRGEISVQSIGFGAEVNSFEARGADGSLLYWVGFGTRLSDIEPPSEIVLSTGEVEAEVDDECVGSYRVRALAVSVDGIGISVPSRGRVEVGPWIIVNALFQEQTGMTVCADAFADRIRVAVWTRDAQVRENGGIGGPCYAALPIEHAEGAPQYLCLPDGTLSRQCAASIPCPGDSRCLEAVCRPSSQTE